MYAKKAIVLHLLRILQDPRSPAGKPLALEQMGAPGRPAVHPEEPVQGILPRRVDAERVVAVGADSAEQLPEPPRGRADGVVEAQLRPQKLELGLAPEGLPFGRAQEVLEAVAAPRRPPAGFFQRFDQEREQIHMVPGYADTVGKELPSMPGSIFWIPSVKGTAYGRE